MITGGPLWSGRHSTTSGPPLPWTPGRKQRTCQCSCKLRANDRSQGGSPSWRRLFHILCRFCVVIASRLPPSFPVVSSQTSSTGSLTVSNTSELYCPSDALDANSCPSSSLPKTIATSLSVQPPPLVAGFRICVGETKKTLKFLVKQKD